MASISSFVANIRGRLPRRRVAPPSPPFIGPAKFHGAPTNKPINRIVIHGTVSSTREGAARATAFYFRDVVTRPSSAHYIVDPGEVIQCVGDSVVAYHAPPNPSSIGVELCDMVVDKSGKPLPMSRWDDPEHTRMLERAARLVARLCLAYRVPIRKLTVADLLDGDHGICGHVDVSNAWHQTSHTDPGNFPWKRFMKLVEAAAEKIR